MVGVMRAPPLAGGQRAGAHEGRPLGETRLSLCEGLGPLNPKTLKRAPEPALAGGGAGRHDHWSASTEYPLSHTVIGRRRQAVAAMRKELKAAQSQALMSEDEISARIENGMRQKVKEALSESKLGARPPLLEPHGRRRADG
eukprot:500407-Prorocentrum_minimum.AAC.2